MNDLEIKHMNNAAVVWLGATIVGFMLWWPIGVAILATVFATALAQFVAGYTGKMRLHAPPFMMGSGNTAFDDYRRETLRKLEEDRVAFSSFLDRLRRAKDQKEFERFMAERR